MNKLPMVWRIGEKPGELFLTWEARGMFNRTLQFLLLGSTGLDTGRTINLNITDPGVQAIGWNVTGMLQFLQRYRVIWMRRTLSFYLIKFQEPVITEFLECPPQELESSLLRWRQRRVQHTQMVKEQRKAAQP